MPVDRYRNQGPDDSEDYHLFEAPEERNYETELKRLLPNGERSDGRKWDEQRKIYLNTGVASSVKGSSYMEVGDTKVVVSVYEPREIPGLSEFSPNGELFVEFRFAPFSGKSRRSPMMLSDEKDLSLILKRALEPAVCRSEFPNCQVDIYVLVLDDGGGSFPAAVTAAGVALADAGIPMFDTVAAVTLGIHGDNYFLDPTDEEEQFCSTSCGKNPQLPPMGLITIAFLPTIGQISSSTLFGCLPVERLVENLDFLIERCCQVTELSRQRLAKDVMKKVKEAEELEASPIVAAS